MVKYQDEIVRNMKQRVRTPQFLNRVIKVYDFTTLFSRLMMYRRAKSSLVQPKKEGEEETTYNMYNSMFIRRLLLRGQHGLRRFLSRAVA